MMSEDYCNDLGYSSLTAVVDYYIDGMTCSMCSQSVEAALTRSSQSDYPNMIAEAKVNLAMETARVTYRQDIFTQMFGTGNNAKLIGYMAIATLVEDVGFGCELQERYHLQLETGGDGSCHEDLERGENNTQPSRAEQEVLQQDRLAKLQDRQRRDLSRKRMAFFFSMLGTFPILVLTMVIHYLPAHKAHHWLDHEVVDGMTRMDLILWILATPVQFGSGWPFYKGTYHGIKQRVLGMDVLIALGSTAAYVFAVQQITVGLRTGESTGQSHFFETAAVLISFVLLGKWLQAYAMRRTSNAMAKLMGLQSKTAVVVTPIANQRVSKTESGKFARELALTQAARRASQRRLPTRLSLVAMVEFDPATDAYTEDEVPIERVRKGDFLKIRRGLSVPTDGRIFHGEVTVDECMLSGESVPVYRTMGSNVIGGTICVEGVAFVQATGVGEESTLNHIVRLVEDAQTNRAPVQDFSDRVSSHFVPAICFVSMVTFFVWFALAKTRAIPTDWWHDTTAVEFALEFGIAVLVISCPCALGLAVPTALMVGTGVGATHGILIKGGEQLQRSSNIDVVVFDKTGTLTRGKPVVTDYEHWGNPDEKQGLLWATASLERQSEHPLGSAIVAFAEETIPQGALQEKPFVEPQSFEAFTGKGMTGDIEGQILVVGNRRLMEEGGISVGEDVNKVMQRLEFEGKTAIAVGVDKRTVAVFGIADEIKQDSAVTIQRLGDSQIDVWMATGDNQRTGYAVARTVHIAEERVLAEASPSEKLDLIKRLQKEGKTVAFCGDGINDSPALVQSDIGVAMGTGADIAAEASDIVLVKGRIFDCYVAIDLAKTIFHRIKLNLMFALIYNTCAIPIAAGVLFPAIKRQLPPEVAAAAMAMSSVSVVVSSLLLRRYQPPTVSVDDLPKSPFLKEANLVPSTMAMHESSTSHSLANKSIP